jgi:heme-degrading monooxygenase HmoA
MIVRIWRGETSADKAATYLQYLEATGVADYTRTAGNRGVLVLRRAVEDRLEWLTISWWDSIEDVRAFAGPDVAKAVYYPGDRDFLLTFEPTVGHYEVLIDHRPQSDGPRMGRRVRSADGGPGAPGG